MQSYLQLSFSLSSPVIISLFFDFVCVEIIYQLSAISTAIFKSDLVIIAAQVKVFTKKALLTMIISASCLTTVTLSEGKNITHLLFSYLPYHKFEVWSHLTEFESHPPGLMYHQKCSDYHRFPGPKRAVLDIQPDKSDDINIKIDDRLKRRKSN